MKRMQKMISCLVLLCLVFALVPAQTMAAETPEVTRAQWVQMLVETFSMTVEENNYPDNYYSDLTGEESYYRDILVATEFGVIDLPAGTPFRPEDAATREFAAHTLNYALGFQLGEDAGYTFAEASTVTYPVDIQVAVNRGWFALSGGKFMPNQVVTAAERDFMLADADKILAEAEVSDGYESVYSFTTEVIEIPNGTQAEYHHNYVVVYDCPVKIRSGNVFAVYFNGLPCLYLAGDVTVSGNATTIAVTELEEDGYYESMDAQGVVDASFTEFEVLEGTEVIYIDEDTGVEYTDPAAAEYAIRARGAKEPNRTLSVKRELKLNGVSGYVQVKMKNPQILYEFKSNFVSVKLVAKLETIYGVSCNFYELQHFDPIPLLNWTAPGVGGLKVSLVMETEASMEGTTSGNLTVGIEYHGGNDFRLVRDFQKTSFAMVLKVSGKVGVEATVGLNDVPGDVIEGYVFAEIGGTGEVESNHYEDNHVCTHAAIYMYAEVGAKVSAKLMLYQKSYEYKNEFWHAGNSPIRIVHHYEDGVLVPGCTRGWVTNDYYTPSDSSYWGSNWSGGNNRTGYDASGKPVILFNYSLDEDGNATITQYSGNANALVIPSTLDGHTVTAIADRVFIGRNELVTVTIPDTVTKIGAGAFAKCYALSTVLLPDNLTSLGAYAFYDCDSLVSIEIPSGLHETTRAYFWEFYKDYVHGPFYGCNNLRVVTFQAGTTEIANGLFAHCPGLESIVIPDTVTLVEFEAFYDCANLESVTLSGALIEIQDKAFGECKSLKSIEIPDTVTRIGAGSFGNCKNLESVTLPKNLKELCSHAFYNCDALTSIQIPAKLETVHSAYIPEYAYDYVYGPFYGCEGLKNVTFEAGCKMVPKGLFANCPGLESIVIPDAVTSVNNSAFYNCVNLESVTFPASLVEIQDKAFAECKAMKSVEIPDAATRIGAGSFGNCKNLESVTLPKNLKELCSHAFYNCDALTSIQIPAKLETVHSAYIPEYAYDYVYGPFYGCDGLNNVTFEEGTKKIQTGLFANCPGLKTIEIPETVTTIQSRAFQASGLTEILLPDTVTTVGDRILADCMDLKKVTWSKNTGTIPQYACAGSKSLVEINLPDEITAIDNGAFRDCDSLVHVKVPASVRILRAEAFYNCDKLESVALPDGLVTLEGHIFYNCDALTEIVIPNQVTSIGKYAFYDCDALTTVTMGDSVTSMGNSVFEKCDVLKNVTLSRNLGAIPEAAFMQCTELSEITVPYYTTSINKNAFSSSPNLKKIVMPRGLTSMDRTALSYSGVTVIYGVSGTYAETWANENGYQFVAQEVAATEIALNKDQLQLNKGASETLILTVKPADSTDVVSWKSANPAVATVSDRGVVKAVGVGSTTIKVNVGSFSASCKVTVLQPITSIGLNTTNLSLEALQTYQLTASVHPNNATNPTYTWSSSDPAVATVSETGLVTALTKGTATITATAADGSGVSRGCTVTVVNSGYVVEDPAQMESSHNYPDNCTDFWTYTLENAEELAVTFHEQTEMEDGFDYLCIYDGSGNLVGKYTGTELAGKTVVVPGDTVKIQLQSDDSGNGWGFLVTEIAANNQAHVHNFGNWEVTEEPGCTEAGLKTSSCACGEKKTEKIPAKGHKEVLVPGKEATCTEPGLTTGFQCSVCSTFTVKQDTIPAKGHRYEDDGDDTCDVCGAERTEEVPSVPMFRMYDPNSGEHFYTGSELERDFLVSAGWHYEGVGFNFPVEGAPVHRLYDPVYGEHLYTMDKQEMNRLLNAGWQYEGVAFNSAGTDEVPQYRLHNPNAKRGGYHFTGSELERDILIEVGWIPQGIGWYSCLE